MNSTTRRLIPHLTAYFILLIIAFVRFYPVVFEGKTLQQSDNLQAAGMQAEIHKVAAETGHYPLWTNSMFSGMPAFQIFMPGKSVLNNVFSISMLGTNMTAPHTGILLIMAGFYLLLIVLGVEWRIAIVGSLGFGLAGNHIHLLEAGHTTKLIATAFIAPTFAGIILILRGKYWLGGGLTALFMALHLFSNHLQITYYFLITLLIFGIVYLIDAIKKGYTANFFKAVAVAAIAIVLAFGTSVLSHWTTYEYSQETIRGKSELSQKTGSTGSTSEEGGGLSKDYAFGWSYGKLELFNLLIPNYVGGSSQLSFASDSESNTMAALRQMQDMNSATQIAQQTTHYWGAQPFTGGGVYLGTVFILLFFLGTYLVRTPMRWFVVVAVILTILMSLGKNLAFFNYFLFDNLPMYNKFRAVTMVLGITNFLVVLLGILGLKEFFDKNTTTVQRTKALRFAGGVTGGLLLLGLLISFGLSYVKEGENFPAVVANALAEDRAGLLRKDALRSAFFLIPAFALLWAYSKGYVKSLLAIIAIGLLSTIDIWGIGTRFIDKDSFYSKTEKMSLVKPTTADEQIMKDTDPHYRVADFRRNPFANAFTSYFHKSIGGYHAAKLMRYQEIVERFLGDPTTNAHIFNMLNTKYFIGQNEQVFPNEEALGNAWFVKAIEVVEDGDAEINAIATFNPSEKAIVQKKFLGELEGFIPQFDSTASIKLTHYNPDTMVYSYSASTDQMAVFSEIYYPPSKGWKMYLDGKPAPDFTKVNFLLRGSKLPAGQHELKMIFAPKSFYTGKTITLISSIIVILLAIWGIVHFFRKYELPEAGSLAEVEPVKAQHKVLKKKKK
jgi:hypothetical protein